MKYVFKELKGSWHTLFCTMNNAGGYLHSVKRCLGRDQLPKSHDAFVGVWSSTTIPYCEFSVAIQA